MILWWGILLLCTVTAKPTSHRALSTRAVDDPPTAGRFFGEGSGAEDSEDEDEEDVRDELLEKGRDNIESEVKDEVKEAEITSTISLPFVPSEAKITEELIRDSFRIDFIISNGSEIVADRSSIFEVIPLDYICDFCLAVIEKLKVRQGSEADFEKNISEECWSYNGTGKDSGTICELVNKVNLERLRNDDPTKICVDEKLCPDIEKEDGERRMKEERIKEENKRREFERKEEERKESILREKERIAQVKEDIKNEASRLELEKRLENEAKRKMEERKNRIHSKTGDFEYVVDEVHDGETNDYLDAPEKKTDFNSGVGDAEGEAAQANSENIDDVAKLTDNDESSHKSIHTHDPDIVEVVPQTIRPTLELKINGDAMISGSAMIQRETPRVIVDRTVSASILVDDVRK